MNRITESLNAEHRESEFSCGKEMLDNYLHKQASQDIKRKLTACFVLIDHESNLIKGYYTLANNSISQEIIPEKFRKILPKSYLSIPATLLGRLAVDQRFQASGIGKLLLIDALRRSYDISKSIG
ncbi:MAG: GNAT family N-acetyltransferase, partial [Bacteroides sp.]|nr:GNAT family N-acetyltransferase [Bacteroides sp.]